MQTKQEEEASSSPKRQKPKQYEQKFCKQWLQDPRLSDWLVEQRDSPFCKPCNKYLRNRKYTLLNHAESSSHKSCVENVKMVRCRVCLEDNDSKFMPRIDSEEYTTKMEITALLLICGGIRIFENSLPDCICLDCLKRLLDAYKFRMLCQASAKQYRNAVCEDSFPVKDEHSVQMETADITHETELPFSAEDCIELVIPEETVIEEPEPHEWAEMNFLEERKIIVEDVHVESDADADADDVHHEDNLDPDESYHHDEVDWTTIQDESEMVDEEEVSVSELIVVKEEIPALKVDEATPTKMMEETSPLEFTSLPLEYEVREIEEKADSPMFMCDLCGNQYNKAFKLKAHLRTHLKIKPFKCEICDKTFAVSGQVKAHMRSHTGEKPFECGHCGRKFSDYGGKNRHERSVHLHQKPYVCEECGKAFSYAATLKKHRRVHTGEKPFECIPCGKGFSESHHLKTHCATIIHRERVSKLLNEDSKSFD